MLLRLQVSFLLAGVVSYGSAFTAAPRAFSSSSTTTTNFHGLPDTERSVPYTVLGISSWGTKGPPHKWADSTSKENPETNVQAYLKEPEAVEARVNIDGKCLVSGLVNDKDRTDQFLFDLLNHEESAFEFDKIVAFVDDAAFSKKRLLSRSARYTGLLDKLEFCEATSKGGLPTAEQLQGVKNWVAVIDAAKDDAMLNTVKEIASLAKASSEVENVAILLAGANELATSDCSAALESLQSADGSLTYTIVAVGKLQDTPEGKEAYHYKEFGSEEGVLPAKAVFSREEAYRMVTELLQLECGSNRALSFAEVYNVNATEVRLIKGLREAGYARPQEIDHMIREGPEVRYHDLLSTPLSLILCQNRNTHNCICFYFCPVNTRTLSLK